VVIFRAQHDFERRPETHEWRKVLDAANAGDQAEGRLPLAENR
jgi:hypothetical protein